MTLLLYQDKTSVTARMNANPHAISILAGVGLFGFCLHQDKTSVGARETVPNKKTFSPAFVLASKDKVHSVPRSGTTVEAPAFRPGKTGRREEGASAPGFLLHQRTPSVSVKMKACRWVESPVCKQRAEMPVNHETSLKRIALC
jgi:hypothetical protein